MGREICEAVVAVAVGLSSRKPSFETNGGKLQLDSSG